MQSRANKKIIAALEIEQSMTNEELTIAVYVWRCHLIQPAAKLGGIWDLCFVVRDHSTSR